MEGEMEGEGAKESMTGERGREGVENKERDMASELRRCNGNRESGKVKIPSYFDVTKNCKNGFILHAMAATIAGLFIRLTVFQNPISKKTWDK